MANSSKNAMPSRLLISQQSTVVKNGLPSPADTLDSPLTEQEPFVSSNGSRRCSFCGATQTPMWRHGPGQYTTLCNSCGVKWRRGKILNSAAVRHPLFKGSNANDSKSKTKTIKISSSNGSIKGQSFSKKHKPNESIDASCYITPDPSPVKASEFERFQGTQSKSEAKLQDKLLNLENDALKTTFENEKAVNDAVLDAKLEIVGDKNDNIKDVIDDKTSGELIQVEATPNPSPTQEFTNLLRKLSADKIDRFIEILSNSFPESIASSYKYGVAVHLPVQDITVETWDLLRKL